MALCKSWSTRQGWCSHSSVSLHSACAPRLPALLTCRSETNRFGPVTALLLTPMYEEDGIRLQASRRALALQEQQRQAQAQAEAEAGAEAPEQQPQHASSRGGIRSSAALRRAPVLALESARGELC